VCARPDDHLAGDAFQPASIESFWWGERPRGPFAVVVSSRWLDEIGAQRRHYTDSENARSIGRANFIRVKRL
jgi:hypothetical protein